MKTVALKYVPLKEVCLDFIVPQRDKPKTFDGDIPWCRIEDIEGRYLNRSKSGQKVSKDLADKMNMHLCPKGTVISACSASIGNQAITTIDCYTNQTFIGLVVNPRLLYNVYLFYFLESQTKNLMDLGQGATIKYISKDKYKKMLIPLPSLSEQQRIVDILDAEFEKIDRLRSNAEQNLRHAKDLFQAALRKELEPKEGWETITLQEFFDITSSKRVFQSDWKKDGVPFYRAREIVKLSKNGHVDNDLFITPEMYDAYKKKYGVPKIGDILITGVGTLGVCYLVSNNNPFYFKDGNVIWLKKTKEISSEYVVLTFLSDDVQKQVHSTQGAVVGTYTIEKAKSTIISIPKTLQKQEAIVSVLNNLNAKCKVLQDNYTKTIALCDDLKQALLRKAFNGEL